MKSYKTIVLASLFLLNSAMPAYSAGFQDVKEYNLDNGLKVLLLEEHKAPVAVFQIWYKVGSLYEPYDKAGISHMLEHMMFKGTKKHGPKTFSQMVQRAGGSDNAFTSQDYTAYFQTLASDRIELSFELESDRMKDLLLNKDEFLSERDVVTEERRSRTEDEPESALGEEVQAAAFKEHPYRWPIIGWMDTIRNFSVKDARHHYETFYEPNNATIVVVGDIDAEKTIADIRRYFGGIPEGPVPPQVVVKEPEQHGERRVYLEKEAQLPTIYILYHVPNLTDPDNFALDVLETVLSGGRSARLYKDLVYDKQIAQSASAGNDSVSKDPETFSLDAQVMPGKATEDVEKALYEEVERLKAEPVGDREMQKAKNQIEASFIMGQDSNFNRAMMLGRYESVASWKLLNSYLDGINAVTPDDLMRVSKKYLVKENRTVGILVPLPIPEGKEVMPSMPGGAVH